MEPHPSLVRLVDRGVQRQTRDEEDGVVSGGVPEPGVARHEPRSSSHAP